MNAYFQHCRLFQRMLTVKRYELTFEGFSLIIRWERDQIRIKQIYLIFLLKKSRTQKSVNLLLNICNINIIHYSSRIQFSQANTKYTTSTKSILGDFGNIEKLSNHKFILK